MKNAITPKKFASYVNYLLYIVRFYKNSYSKIFFLNIFPPFIHFFINPMVFFGFFFIWLYNIIRDWLTSISLLLYYLYIFAFYKKAPFIQFLSIF